VERHTTLGREKTRGFFGFFFLVSHIIRWVAMADNDGARDHQSRQPSSQETAADAIQRATEAMIAATESFRRQFTNNGSSQQSYTPVVSYEYPPQMSGRESPDSFATMGDHQEPQTGISSMDHPFESDSPFQHQPPPTTRAYSASMAMPYIAPQPEFFPMRPAMARLNTTGMPAQTHGITEPAGNDFFVVDLPPRIGDWPTKNGSTPTLADTPVKGNYENRQSMAHVDLYDPAPKSKAYRASNATTLRPDSFQVRPNESTHSLSGTIAGDLADPTGKMKKYRASTMSSFNKESYPDTGEATPATIQIGRYTYVRQDTHVDREAELQKGLMGTPARKGHPGGPPLSFWHEVLFVLMIAAAQALMLSGVSQAMVPASIIGSSFGLTHPADLAWFSAAYALTSGTFVLPAGRLGDLFGHKKIFVIGFFWFGLWSFITGFSLQVFEAGGNGVVFFNFCRAMQGIGPALLVPNGQAMLGRAYAPGPRKALVMSLFGASAPFGFVMGGVMSSVFAELASWPWSFWVLAAVCIALGAGSLAILPNNTETKKSQSESLWTQLDATGMILGVSGLVLFNFAWNQAPLVSWNTPYTYFLLIISLLLMFAFVYMELRAVYPLVPVQAMTSQTNFVLCCVAAGWGCFSVWIFYTFQFLQTLRGWSPLGSIAAHSPGPIAGLIASLLVAKYIMKVGPHWIMLISMCAFFLGSLFMATAPVEQTYFANTLLSALIMPFGMDMSNPAATILLSNSVSKEHQGIAASLVVTVVNYSISTALGFAATIEVQVNPDGTKVFQGIRAAQYFGIGLGFLGMCIALAYAISMIRKKKAAGPSKA
jgi:MFS family permease